MRKRNRKKALAKPILTAREYVEAFDRGETPPRINREGYSDIADVEKRLDKFARKRWGI